MIKKIVLFTLILVLCANFICPDVVFADPVTVSLRTEETYSGSGRYVARLRYGTRIVAEVEIPNGSILSESQYNALIGQYIDYLVVQRVKRDCRTVEDVGDYLDCFIDRYQVNTYPGLTDIGLGYNDLHSVNYDDERLREKAPGLYVILREAYEAYGGYTSETFNRIQEYPCTYLYEYPYRKAV
ncbi:MAG: hypothetical protein IKP28_02415 [Clostridia bacterium]|nr:hypothetical protein [Clostridia bacterium]